MSAKNKNQMTPPPSLVEMQKNFFKNLSEARPELRDNFVIYHDAYRVRLQSALEEDLPVSTLLMGEAFLLEFENFAKALSSQTYTLNELIRFWKDHLKKNLVHEAKKEILEVVELEWHLVRSYYRSEHSDEEEHFVLLDEESGSSVIIPSATFLLPFEYDVVTAYQNEELPKKKKTWVLVWTNPNSEDGAMFKAIDPEQADIFESLETHDEIDQVISELQQLGFSEKKLAAALQSFFEFGTREAFLIYQA